MFRAVFGKRADPAEPQPVPSAPGDGVTRVFPTEIFEGETGDFLRSMGYDPDAAGNVLDNGEPPVALLANDRAEFDNIIAKVEPQMGFRLAPCPLLPTSLWHSEHGWFLARQLDLMPCRPWNTILLPADRHGAERTGLPIASSFPAAEDGDGSLVQFISEIRAAFTGESDNVIDATMIMFDGVAENFPRNIPAEPPGRSEQVRQARLRVRALAFAIGGTRIGKETILASHATFIAEPDVQLTD